jgi:two-component system LytT family response regulator
MNRIRLLIADDEKLIRSGIRATLSSLPGLVDIVGECENGSETVRSIREQKPDLVLLDVRMPGPSGLEVVRQIGPELMPMVIFVTAYDEYAIRAFELNAVDYLLKPFDEERLISSIERARERLAEKSHPELIKQLQALLEREALKWPERLAVPNKGSYEMVPVDTIDWIEAADNYVQLHCGNRTHLLNDTMANLPHTLDPDRFARVHRGRMVNVSRIAKVTPLGNGAYELSLQSGARLTTGRQYRRTVLGLIGKSD